MGKALENQTNMSRDTETHGSGGTIGQLVDDTGLSYAAVTVGLPVVASIAAIGIRNGELLNFVHVIAGGIWAGAAVLFAGVLSPTLNELDDDVQGTVTVALIPKGVLLFSGMAFATLTTGPVLAVEFGLWNLSNPYLIAGVLIGVGLLVLVFYIVRLQLLAFDEVRSAGPPDEQRLGQIGRRLGQAGPVVLALQLAALVSMALIRTGGI